MSTAPTPTAARAPWRRIAGLAAVVLVPLTFAGLFVGALGDGATAVDRIPAAIVNDDTLITTTAADGTEQKVFAGRLLVTELTGAEGFDWVITNADAAETALANGEVYAILTIPSNFSESILSLSGDAPQQADISIRTDDAHGYLTGSVAQVVGQTMTDTFGKAITAQYIGGIYASIGDLGGALTEAADGATQLSAGAESFSSGLQQYTGGVDSLAGGLSQLDSGADGLSGLSSGVATYTASVSQLAAGLAAVNPAIQGNPTIDPAIAGAVQGIVDGLAQASAGGQTLAAQSSSAISGIQSGISDSASGASQLATGSTGLNTGATSLATGAGDLATGLQEGADQLPAADADALATSAEIAASPVGLTVSTDNPVSEVGQLVATVLIPLGLWIGALAVFLVLRPVTRRALASTARDGRLVASAMVRAAAVTVAQALLLVALLHGALGVGWQLLPATLGLSLLMALAFTAFHYLLTVGLGRAGLVLSLFLLAIQITSTGGVYPIEMLSTPFQVASPLLPLTYAVSGMQGIIAGGNAGGIVVDALMLFAFGVGSVLVALLVMRKTRRAASLGLVPQPA